MRLMARSALCLILLAVPVGLFAQATTGTLTGSVTSEGRPLPGVTVTVASPSMQGTKTAVSGEAGGYNFPSLPPEHE